MKNIISFIATLLFLAGYGQTTKTVALADNLLKSGQHKVALITYDFPADIKRLQNKAITHLKSDPQWADSYVIIQIEKGAKDLEFLEAYGLTRTEFYAMLKGFLNGKQVVVKDTSTLQVQKPDGVITLKGSPKLKSCNYLTIDTKKKQIRFDNNSITREVELTGQKNYAPLLHGYEAFWDLKIPSSKQQSSYTSAGFSVGTNSGDSRPVLCLILQKSVSETEFITVLFLD